MTLNFLTRHAEKVMTEWYDFLKVKFTKMLRFFSVVEVHGLIYRRPLGQNSSFASSYLKHSLDSVAPCGASCLVNSTAFFLYVMHLLIFSKRVRGELSFQRGAIIMAIRQTSFKGGGEIPLPPPVKILVVHILEQIHGRPIPRGVLPY